MNCFDYRLVRQLTLLAAVADAGSVSKAAEELAISVPPIVAQLNELETRFEQSSLIHTKLHMKRNRPKRLSPKGANLSVA